MRTLMTLAAALFAGVLSFATAAPAAAGQRAPRATPADAAWVVAWTGSAHGPYPIGNPLAQPDLSLALPSPETGARDQDFRLIVRPSIWGREARIRLSNVHGRTPVTFADVHVGLQLASSALVAGSNRPVRFAGRPSVTVAPGEAVWSDGVALPFVRDPADPLLDGRKLAVSVRIVGASGPMTWHAKALQTSYIGAPGAAAATRDESEAGFPFSTTSWFFLDAVEMRAPAGAYAVVAFGDSITDGTLSTLNGDDRWPDVLARRLRARHGPRVSVVNAGIGGNRVIGPADYAAPGPVSGGPSALARLDRDVLALSGVAAVVWLEGINDLSRTVNEPVEAIEAGFREGVRRIRARIPGVRVIGATLTPTDGAASQAHGFPEQHEKRARLNAFIRTSGLFDGVADFDAAVAEPGTNALRRAFVHDTAVGGPGDKLHPNRLGYLAMGMAIDLDLLKPAAVLRDDRASTSGRARGAR